MIEIIAQSLCWNMISKDNLLEINHHYHRQNKFKCKKGINLIEPIASNNNHNNIVVHHEEY